MEGSGTMAQEGATLAVDTSNLISSLFALLPVPVAVIDCARQHRSGELNLQRLLPEDFQR